MKRQGMIFLLISAVILCSIISTGAKAKKTFAENGSTATTCAEEDNINVCLLAKKLKKFRVIAKHPAYAIGVDNCAADFSGCPAANGNESHQAAESCQKIWDDGINVIEVCSEPEWWRPFSMSVKANNISAAGHRLVISKKVEGESSWPQFMVLYEDGNMRLKPHPSIGREDVCFGSSVIIGPVAPGIRPFVDIEEISIDPSTSCLEISYRDGGNARICLSVDRTQAVADAKVEYDLGNCFAVFRSMWVEDGNSDVDHIESRDGNYPILSGWTRLRGTTWFFRRMTRSRHNTSAPDILIEAIK